MRKSLCCVFLRDFLPERHRLITRFTRLVISVEHLELENDQVLFSTPRIDIAVVHASQHTVFCLFWPPIAL